MDVFGQRTVFCIVMYLIVLVLLPIQTSLYFFVGAPLLSSGSGRRGGNMETQNGGYDANGGYDYSTGAGGGDGYAMAETDQSYDTGYAQPTTAAGGGGKH